MTIIITTDPGDEIRAKAKEARNRYEDDIKKVMQDVLRKNISGEEGLIRLEAIDKKRKVELKEIYGEHYQEFIELD